MTEGSILRALMGLAMPIMASSFLSTAYNITDMAWIGTLGAKAVAGVGVAGMYMWLSQGLCSLARMGGQVYVAQCIGKGEQDQAGKYAAAALQLTALFGILFAAVCLLFTDPLIDFFGIQDMETRMGARVYMKITCGLLLFPYLNTTLTGIFTAQGDSRTPFKANLIGLVINMVLDPLLILGFGPFPRLETMGAAIATVLAQIVVTAVLWMGIRHSGGEASASLRSAGSGSAAPDSDMADSAVPGGTAPGSGVADSARSRFITTNVLKNTDMCQRISGEYFRDICRIGVPTALQGTVYCMISMVLTRMVAGFGPEAVATQRVGGQIESLSWNTAEGFATALNAFCGQNYGAGRMDRVKKGYRISFFTIALWGLLVSAVFIFFPGPIAGIFFHEQSVYGIAQSYLRILGFGEAFMCVELMAVGAVSGLGNTRICSLCSICLTGLRIPLAMVLSRTGLGLDGIWWALSLTSMIKGCVMHGLFYRQCRILQR